MEKSLFISNSEKLKHFTSDYSRLYFGNEFCQHLIPPVDQLRKIINFTIENNLKFTLVTPYVTNEYLERVESSLKVVAEEKKGSEVVFNDWGILHLLNNHYLELKPVMGRLLNRMTRDPRLMNVIEKLPESSVKYFRKSNLTVPVFRRFLKKNRISRVEFDNFLQGIDMNLGKMGIEGSLYYPFVYITTTRLCLSNFCDIPEKEKKVGIFPCGRECLRYTFQLENPIMPVPLIRKGNTIFFRNDQLDERMEEKGINRLVFEPEIIV